MTGPIIDPMWFYWLQVFDSLRVLLLIAAVFVFVGDALTIPVLLESYDEERRKVKNAMIALLVLAVTLAMAGVMTPTKETMIQMEIARHVTYESTETVVETITDTANSLLEKLMEGRK